MQEPGDAGLARAHEIIMLLCRAHLRAWEALDCDAPARFLLQLVRPPDQPLRHGVLIADEIGELELDRLRAGNAGAEQHRQRGGAQAGAQSP